MQWPLAVTYKDLSLNWRLFQKLPKLRRDHRNKHYLSSDSPDVRWLPFPQKLIRGITKMLACSLSSRGNIGFIPQTCSRVVLHMGPKSQIDDLLMSLVVWLEKAQPKACKPWQGILSVKSADGVLFCYRVKQHCGALWIMVQLFTSDLWWMEHHQELDVSMKLIQFGHTAKTWALPFTTQYMYRTNCPVILCEMRSTHSL